MNDQVQKAAARLSSGLTGKFFATYVGASIPADWQLDGRVDVTPAMRDDLIVVHAKAWSPTMAPVGARITVPHTADIQAVAAELSALLQSKIADYIKYGQPIDPRLEIRFSLVDGARQPTRGSERASGYDLHALTSYVLNPGQIAVVDTGVILELPPFTEGQVRPRSGMTKRGIWVALGTIDEDYRGTVGATVINHTRDNQTIAEGDRIAQLVIAPVLHRPWRLVDRETMVATARGERGWGSTGA